MTVVRTLFVAGGLVVALGCAGVGERVMEAADADIDVAQGTDATRPADFPLPEPSVGTLENTMTGSMGGTSATTLVYTLPPDADLAAVMAPYKAKMEELGYQVNDQTANGSHTVSGMKGQDMLTATAMSGTLTLISAHVPTE